MPVNPQAPTRTQSTDPRAKHLPAYPRAKHDPRAGRGLDDAAETSHLQSKLLGFFVRTRVKGQESYMVSQIHQVTAAGSIQTLQLATARGCQRVLWTASCKDISDGNADEHDTVEAYKALHHGVADTLSMMSRIRSCHDDADEVLVS